MKEGWTPRRDWRPLINKLLDELCHSEVNKNYGRYAHALLVLIVTAEQEYDALCEPEIEAEFHPGEHARMELPEKTADQRIRGSGI